MAEDGHVFALIVFRVHDGAFKEEELQVTICGEVLTFVVLLEAAKVKFYILIF